MRTETFIQCRIAYAAMFSLVLAACGGGGATTDIGIDRSAAAAALSTSTAGTRPPVATTGAAGANADPVLTEAFAAPSDPAARTRAALYLSARGALELERRLGGDVVWVHVPCCGAAHRDLAILVAFGMQASQNLDNEAPFLVRGQNPREAAAVADRLTAAGMRRVIVVAG